VRPALRYELVRIRTLRATWWLAIAVIAAAALLSFGISWDARTTDHGPDGLAWALSGGGAFAPLPLPAVCAGLFGVFAFGHEFRYGTVKSLLSAVPRRWPVFAAKVVTTAVVSLIFAVLALASAYVVAWLTAREATLRYDPFTGLVGRVVLGYVLLIVLWGLVGLAFGALIRSLPVAVALLLVIPLIVENVIAAVLFLVDALDPIAWLTKYLPFGAGQQMVSTGSILDTGPAPQSASPLVGGITFSVFTLLVLIAAAVTFDRRDA
jgi:ABC-2 type transport system permease protein